MKIDKKFKYLSISSRISILLGIIILFTMGIFSTYSLIKQKEDAIISINHNMGQLSQTIERILRVSMLRNRRDDISSAIKNIVGNEGIESVRIINHKGQIKFSSKQSEINEKLPVSNDLCISCHNKKGQNLHYDFKNVNRFHLDNKNNLIYCSLPINNAPSCYNGACHSTNEQTLIKGKKKLPKTLYKSGTLNEEGLSEKTNLITSSPHKAAQKILGFIEIEVSIKKIITNLVATRNKLIIFTILFALLASIITYFSIRYLIGRPVKNLVEGTMRVAEGNFKHEIPPGKAELKLLADSFNKMQKQLLSTQRQLIESEKLAFVGKLADEIALEINNPLTGIIIYSESLIKRLSSDTEVNDAKITDSEKQDYETILQEALKIRESIRNILSLTRQEKPTFKMIRIGRIIKHSISVVDRFSNFRNIQIITAIPKNLPEISADSALMEQVFFNLFLISSETMFTGGIINISAAYSDNTKEIEIVFTDTGKGLPEIVIQKIFEQVPVLDMENFEKIGISLTVCKNIIEMHKGKIFINPTGAGTLIKIKLPV